VSPDITCHGTTRWSELSDINLYLQLIFITQQRFNKIRLKHSEKQHNSQQPSLWSGNNHYNRKKKLWKQPTSLWRPSFMSPVWPL